MAGHLLKSISKSALPIAGAALGSAVPGVGTVLGASLGGGLSGALSGKGIGGILGSAAGAGLGSYAGTALGGGLSGALGNGVSSGATKLASGGSLIPSLSGGGQSSFGSILGNSSSFTPLLSGGLGVYSNNKAKKQLLASQKANMGVLSPFLNESFTPGDLTQDPGYQFQLEQGTKALNQKNAAAGNYFSGDALKAAQDYGQGLAGTTYNDAYQRFLSTQGQKLQAAGGITGINDNIGNIKAGATKGVNNVLSGSAAALFGGTGIGADGQSLGGSDYTTMLMQLLARNKSLYGGA